MTAAWPAAIGLDLSLTSTGVALASRSYATEKMLVTTRAIKSEPAPAAERTPNVRARRIGTIIRDVEADVRFTRPDIAVVESPVPNRRMKSAMLLERGALYWGVLAMLDRYKVEIVEAAPKERALYATGDGAAGKLSVARAMMDEGAGEFATDDESDAYVLALIGMRLLGHPIDRDEPHRLTVAANLAAKRGNTSWS